MISGLPIDAALPALCAALRNGHTAVLQAPPGAGKSTVVPLALLEQSWADGRRILLLEPRRLAARAVARRMAHTLREGVGETVGYRMRMDTRVSARTRIEVVTEGVLTRLLQADPALEGVAAVLFDEYHERSLQADLGLALTLDCRAQLAPELRVIVMSATLDGERVAQLLGDAPLVSAQGQMHPVEVCYIGQGAPALPDRLRPVESASLESLTMRGVLQALREHEGDVLVFLPGQREIRRVHGLLLGAALPADILVLPLFGELSAPEQELALQPAPAGTRKVVLSTNIAETSLTIEGVRLIVDSGLMRRSSFDPVSGMSRLVTVRISRAAAEQRRGRAGRLAPGVCYRLWSAEAQRSLAPFSPPEIVDADLTPVALELAAWGIREVGELRWLDTPPAAPLASCRQLLRELGALDRHGRITEHGRHMLRLSTHPRLAHLLLRSAGRGGAELAAQLAAVLSERDLLRTGNGERDVDIRSRLELLDERRPSDQVDRNALQRVRRAAQDLQRQLSMVTRRSAAGSSTAPTAGVLLAFAYPDRIGRRRAGAEARYTLTNGRGAFLAQVHSLGREEYIVAVELDDKDRDARILLAAPLQRVEIEQAFAEQLQRTETVVWDSQQQAVLARRILRLQAIVLEDNPMPQVPPDAARAAMLAGVREMGLEALPWTETARTLQARVTFVRTVMSEAEWPDFSAAALGATLDTWLEPWLAGITRRTHLAKLDLAEILRARLSWQQQRQLDALAPTHLQVPSGSSIRIDYLDESAPVVAVRLQEVFGLAATPRIAAERVAVTLKLLSPAQRPVQITRDLASFWRDGYLQVRKDLRGRYPKHYWPEDPLEAEPTRGVRRRR